MSAPDAPTPQETLLHIAELRHWESARDTGVSYAMSTLGRTLQEEGFIHCSSDLAQVEGVLGRFYSGVPRDSLVLLVVDPSLLDVAVRYEPAGGELFPHVFGEIPLRAIIEARSLPRTR